MSLPEHQNLTASGRTATAPYNFVPLPEKVVPSPVVNEQAELPRRDLYHKELYTGVIQCELRTETPLYTRAALEKKEYFPANDENRIDVKDKPDFFYVDPEKQDPVIPGSGIRGTLRTLMEIISYGKVYPVSSTPLVYRALADHCQNLRQKYQRALMQEGARHQFTPRVLAGYMERNQGQIPDPDVEWFIRPARSINGTTFARIPIKMIPRNLKRRRGCRNAYELWIRPGPYEFQDVRGGFIKIKNSRVLEADADQKEQLIHGVLARSGKMSSKRKEAVVFPADPNAQPIPVSEQLVNAYRDQISQEQQSILGSDGVLNENQPVFYIVEHRRSKGQELIFFGHTMMMRMVYPHSPRDFVPENLRSSQDIDVAEALFGTVESEASARVIAGRVSVSDAYLADDQPKDAIWLSDSPITPKILSGPKPTTFQHYLTQQTPNSVPAGTTKDGQPKTEIRLHSYADSPGSTTVIRGHKRYWSKGPLDDSDFQESDEVLAELAKADDTQHTRIKPVRAGTRFNFHISFENLDRIELGALLWILTLPGDEGKEYRHRIGMGKPLGMGVVKIEPTLFLSDRSSRYTTLFDHRGWDTTERKVLPDETEQFTQEFALFIQRGLATDESAVTNWKNALSDAERVQILLRLLEWPGPAKEVTDYMQLGKFRPRPVLPDALHVQREGGPTDSRWTTSAKSESKRRQVKNPTAKIRSGDILSGTVLRFEKARYYVEIGAERPGELHKREFAGKPTPQIGDEIEVEVEEVIGRKRVRLILSDKGK